MNGEDDAKNNGEMMFFACLTVEPTSWAVGPPGVGLSQAKGIGHDVGTVHRASWWDHSASRRKSTRTGKAGIPSARSDEGPSTQSDAPAPCAAI